jgi:DNA-directed RNA polymerase I subunit RPA2
MVKSRACYLRHLTRRQLVAAKEESTEFGGYFICNGIERVLRALIAPRRHVALGLRRGAYARRGQRFTDLAVSLRCVAPDETSAVVRAHYLADGVHSGYEPLCLGPSMLPGQGSGRAGS